MEKVTVAKLRESCGSGAGGRVEALGLPGPEPEPKTPVALLLLRAREDMRSLTRPVGSCRTLLT